VLGYRDGVRNLREIGEALFDAIVVGGARADQGMISFAEALGPGEADAIHAWVIARANEDYAGDAGN
jgi:quinohemoprotein ethanol dehydrogenase